MCRKQFCGVIVRGSKDIFPSKKRNSVIRSLRVGHIPSTRCSLVKDVSGLPHCNHKELVYKVCTLQVNEERLKDSNPDEQRNDLLERSGEGRMQNVTVLA